MPFRVKHNVANTKSPCRVTISSISGMFIKAEDYILCWLTNTPFIAMIVTRYDCNEVFDVSVDCVPEGSIFILVGGVKAGLYRTAPECVRI